MASTGDEEVGENGTGNRKIEAVILREHL
jgi:nitrogen regulatory protein PII